MAEFTKDHPRVCGEKAVCHADAAAGVGSPPRMRGKVLAKMAKVDGAGITPAYAGKSALVFDTAIIRKDHPRVCGEKKLRCQ